MSWSVRNLSCASKNFNFKGVYAPLVTPFKLNGDIDFDKMEYNVKKYENEANLSGYVIGASYSEVGSLTPNERIDLISFVRKLIKPHKIILGGATAESTKLACEMSEAMATAGADVLQVLPPFYFKGKMTDEAIAKHYLTLADKSPVPVVIYNNPTVSGIDINYKLLAKLADHPNIIGVKDSDVRKVLMTILETKGKDFNILAAATGYLLPIMLMGGSGGIMGLASLLPTEVSKLYDLIVENKIEEATELQKRLIPPEVLILGSLGVANLKYAMELKGFKTGHCRSPLIDVNDNIKVEIENALKTHGFL